MNTAHEHKPGGPRAKRIARLLQQLSDRILADGDTFAYENGVGDHRDHRPVGVRRAQLPRLTVRPAAGGSSPGPEYTRRGSMQDRASPPVPATSADNVVAVPGVLEAVIRALAAALASSGAQPAQPGEPADGRPLLDLEETAELLGVSHMTVARMADEGRLPSVVIRRGLVQKIRRIPRAFVDQMIADVCAGAQVEMEDYAAAWLAEHAAAPGDAAQGANQESRRSA